MRVENVKPNQGIGVIKFNSDSEMDLIAESMDRLIKKQEKITQRSNNEPSEIQKLERFKKSKDVIVEIPKQNRDRLKAITEKIKTKFKEDKEQQARHKKEKEKEAGEGKKIKPDDNVPPTPTEPTTPPPETPPVQQQPQIQTQQQPATTIVTTPAIPVTPGNASVDFGTLITVITPILAGIAGIFIKNRKDMEKKNEDVKEETIKSIEAAILPKLKQITPVAEQTAAQDVKISQLAEELYKFMAEKANEIHDKPEIQQQKLNADVVKSKMIAEQTKEPSMVWDKTTNSWLSK